MTSPETVVVCSLLALYLAEGESMDAPWWIAIVSSVFISFAVNLLTPWARRRMSMTSKKRREKAELRKKVKVEFEQLLVRNTEAAVFHLHSLTIRIVSAAVFALVPVFFASMVPVASIMASMMNYPGPFAKVVGILILTFVLFAFFQSVLGVLKLSSEAYNLRVKIWKSRGWPEAGSLQSVSSPQVLFDPSNPETLFDGPPVRGGHYVAPGEEGGDGPENPYKAGQPL